MIYVISVSKTHKHRGKNIRQRDNTKKFWQVMYYHYNEDGELQLYSQFVNPLMALYYKTRKVHRIKGICQICCRAWIYFLKFFKGKDGVSNL